MISDKLINALLATLTTLSVFLFGAIDGLFKALVALVVIDYITGVLAAICTKTLSSAVGWKGIARKIFIMLMVVVANLVDINVIGEGRILRTVVIIFYISNECISLCENAAILGVPLPKKLVAVLKQLKSQPDKIDTLLDVLDTKSTINSANATDNKNTDIDTVINTSNNNETDEPASIFDLIEEDNADIS